MFTDMYLIVLITSTVMVLSLELTHRVVPLHLHEDLLPGYRRGLLHGTPTYHDRTLFHPGKKCKLNFRVIHWVNTRARTVSRDFGRAPFKLLPCNGPPR